MTIDLPTDIGDVLAQSHYKRSDRDYYTVHINDVVSLLAHIVSDQGKEIKKLRSELDSLRSNR